MAKRIFNLTAKQATALRHAEDATADGALRTRLQAVRLYGTNYPQLTILDVTGCSLSRLRAWVQLYGLRGCEGLHDHRCGGNSANLSPDQRQELASRLHQYTPHEVLGSQTQTPQGQFWSVEDLQAVVLRWYGVEYQSRVSYYNLLATCGFRFQRTEKVFKSQRPGEIAAIEELLEKNC